MRNILAVAAIAFCFSSSAVSASCPTLPPPPATPAALYYDASDRAAWDAIVIAQVAGTAPNRLTATDVGYVLIQVRRFTFGIPASDPWGADDRALFTSIVASAMEGSANLSYSYSGRTPPAAPDYGPIVLRAQTEARIVMDFRKTRIC